MMKSGPCAAKCVCYSYVSSCMPSNWNHESIAARACVGHGGYQLSSQDVHGHAPHTPHILVAIHDNRGLHKICVLVNTGQDNPAEYISQPLYTVTLVRFMACMHHIQYVYWWTPPMIHSIYYTFVVAVLPVGSTVHLEAFHKP